MKNYIKAVKVITFYDRDANVLKVITFYDRDANVLKVYHIGDLIPYTCKIGNYFVTPMGGIYDDEAVVTNEVPV